MERWIFHKLNVASAQVNIHLEQRNFMAATTAIYNFWLYELCDVYIVCLLHYLQGNTHDNYFTGGNETNVRSHCPSKDPRFGTADTLHVSRLWPQAPAPIHAFRYGGIVATAPSESQ